VTLHAWLIDCEPVLATKNMILVAFRTPIHRKTVERPESKALIEKVISRVLGSPYQLQTVMVAEWKKLKASIQEQRGAKEEAAAAEKKSDNSDQGNDIVKRAVDLFGTDLVEIVSD
jgi:DNA polymerase-3 subunit gamma/tau